jgi:hypothetical protein
MLGNKYTAKLTPFARNQLPRHCLRRRLSGLGCCPYQMSLRLTRKRMSKFGTALGPFSIPRLQVVCGTPPFADIWEKTGRPRLKSYVQRWAVVKIYPCYIDKCYLSWLEPFERINIRSVETLRILVTGISRSPCRGATLNAGSHLTEPGIPDC